MRKTITTVLLAMLLAAPAAYVTGAPVDSDGDGVDDNVDNCTNVANPDQRDTDSDGFGNRCDADLNDDCIVNPIDLGIFRARFFSTDPDADFNGDGVVNPIDLGILRSLFFAQPGPSGGQTICSCVPPDVVPQPDPNFEFNGQEVYLLGALTQDGMAVSGVNNFADQDNGLYLARIYARSAGNFEMRIADQSSAIEYCSADVLMPYAAQDIPLGGCGVPPGSVEIPAPGCYEFTLRTDGSALGPSIELTLLERLGRWAITAGPAGGQFTLPNGIVLDIPAGAVPAPVELSLGDVACEQFDALFAATTINSHDNRCLGAFAGEPTGFTFDLPVDVSVPIATRTADEFALWLSSRPGRKDYTLAETTLTFIGSEARVEATLNDLALYAVAGGTNTVAPVVRAGGTLPPCCSDDDNTDVAGCCCSTYRVVSAAGDTTSTNCDCELLGTELEIEFPNCPGSPVFFDSETHASENCPTDFQAGISSESLNFWKCETRDLEVSLSGTNQGGSACSLPLPVNWSVGNENVATISGTGANSATLTGVGAGTTTITASSLVGSQFSFVTNALVEALDGQWLVTEDGNQTCVIDGESISESDGGSDTVGLTSPTCTTFELDVGQPGLDGLSGTLSPTGDAGTPFDFQVGAQGSSNTLACALFFAFDGQATDFGAPLCAGDGVTCQAVSCTETINTTGSFSEPLFSDGEGTSVWTFNASWLETVDGDTIARSAVCNGSSAVTLQKQ